MGIDLERIFRATIGAIFGLLLLRGVVEIWRRSVWRFDLALLDTVEIAGFLLLPVLLIAVPIVTARRTLDEESVSFGVVVVLLGLTPALASIEWSHI